MLDSLFFKKVFFFGVFAFYSFQNCFGADNYEFLAVGVKPTDTVFFDKVEMPNPNTEIDLVIYHGDTRQPLNHNSGSDSVTINKPLQQIKIIIEDNKSKQRQVVKIRITEKIITESGEIFYIVSVNFCQTWPLICLGIDSENFTHSVLFQCPENSSISTAVKNIDNISLSGDGVVELNLQSACDNEKTEECKCCCLCSCPIFKCLRPFQNWFPCNCCCNHRSKRKISDLKLDDSLSSKTVTTG
jgi:hypothetical protein